AAAAGLPANTYFYKVTALINGVESNTSPELQATLAGTGTITLRWNPVTGAAQFNVYRGTAAGAQTLFYTTAGAVTTFLDNNGPGSTPVSPGHPPVAHYNLEPAFRELGLTSTPTPFVFNDGTTPDVEFTLHVGTDAKSGDVDVFLPSNDSFDTIDDLVAALQAAVNTALDQSALGTHDSDGDGVPD